MWFVGIDEAGYGPNLGPFVMASTTARVVDDGPVDFWERLQKAVARRADRCPERLTIDDSKRVNEGPTGTQRLERSALGWTPSAGTATAWIERSAIGSSVNDVAAEPWFRPEDPLPCFGDHPTSADRIRLADAAQSADVEIGPTALSVVPAPRFNRLVDQWGVKSGVTADSVVQLLRNAVALPGADAVIVNLDRLGGRTHYAPLIHEAFPDGWVVVRAESARSCAYEVEHLSRPLSIVIEPKADQNHFLCAAASVIAKYCRELCMQQFNRYWADRLPGLPPTAGYPVDALRFMSAIRPTLLSQGIPEEKVWRKR